LQKFLVLQVSLRIEESLKMKILVARIPEEGSHYEGSEPEEIMGVEDDSFVRVTGNVQYDLYAQCVSEELVVRGKLWVGMDLRCTRCTEFFSTTVTVSDFLRAYSASKDVDSVDITEDMREELLLHIPGFPVCGEGCKGLCAQCGADLNKGSCGCGTGERPSPWTALDSLNL
jgi:uncharacterized protein